MRSKKGQILLHELLLNALPQLPTDFEEKMMVGIRRLLYTCRHFSLSLLQR